MRGTQGRGTARLAAIATGAAFAVTVGLAATPAVADGIKAKYKGNNGDQGQQIAVKGGTPWAGVKNLEVDGTGEILSTYCIDYTNPVGEGDNYSEGEWADTWLGKPENKAAAAKIKWILINSFPTKTVADLKTAANVAGLDQREAGAATQAAIWHFSDKIELDKDKEKNDDVEKLYDYLLANAKADTDTSTKFSLELTPDNVAGKPSDKPGVGPLTVNTSAKGKEITAKLDGAPAGTKLVDKDGKEVTGKVGDQDKLYVKPADGSNTGAATVQVSGTSTVDIGRVFQGVKKNSDKSAQLLILAGQKPVKVDDESKVKWAASGALPSFTAEQTCVEGGVEVTAQNKGDLPFDFTLDGKKSTVKPGESVKQVVKVAEDQAYTIKILGPDNQTLKEFTGVLDCKTASTTGGGGTPPPSTSPSPVPSSAPPATTPPAAEGPELAKTGGGSDNSMLFLSGAAVLLLGGGLVFFVVRRRGAAAS